MKILTNREYDAREMHLAMLNSELRRMLDKIETLEKQNTDLKNENNSLMGLLYFQKITEVRTTGKN